MGGRKDGVGSRDGADPVTQLRRPIGRDELRPLCRKRVTWDDTIIQEMLVGLLLDTTGVAASDLERLLAQAGDPAKVYDIATNDIRIPGKLRQQASRCGQLELDLHSSHVTCFCQT